MIRRNRAIARLTLSCATIFALPGAVAQADPSWQPSPFSLNEVGGPVLAQLELTEEVGPVLYVGGAFYEAGFVPARGIARWDGSGWSPLGDGIDGSVHALAAFDDGSGLAVYAGGAFSTAGGVAASNVAKWDGADWSPLGSGVDAPVRSLFVYDDGGGPALYVGGQFTTAGGSLANRIARWDGVAWSPVGAGFEGGPGSPAVLALEAHDDGSGLALYAGGSFTMSGGLAVGRLARWDGSSWEGAGSGINGEVVVLRSIDAGSGLSLYVGGEFTQPQSRIARWDGSALLRVGSADLDGGVYAIDVHSIEDVDSLVIAGNFRCAPPDCQFEPPVGPVAYLFVTPFGDRFLRLGASDQTSPVRSLAKYAGGGGPAQLVADGSVLEGDDWTALRADGLDDLTRALLSFDDGTGPALYAGGDFFEAGDRPANRIARWHAGRWRPLGAGISGTVHALAAFDDGGGDGAAVYAGGDFTSAGGVAANRIARWDGQQWTALGSGLGGVVLALAVFDDGSGPALFAGGAFGSAGGAPASNVAKWNGNAWSPLGSGTAGIVHALAVWDDGTTARLVAGGWFDTAGGVAAKSIAAWDGASWSPIGGGLGRSVRSIAAFDAGQGAGPELYAGGDFGQAGDPFPRRFARFDGATWQPVQAGIIGGFVRALSVLDVGEGESLYVGGEFFELSSTRTIARWDGTTITPVGSEVDGTVYALARHANEYGDGLYAAGDFTAAEGRSSQRVALWVDYGIANRAGTVDLGSGPPVDVLTVDGSVGDPTTREVVVTAGVPATIALSRPPAGGNGHYALWAKDGEPPAATVSLIRYQAPNGNIHELGRGAACLPINNSIVRGFCPCSHASLLGRTSRDLGVSNAARYCVNSQPGFPRAPTSFQQTFPPGTFTLGGVIIDPASASTKAISLMNWIVVRSN